MSHKKVTKVVWYILVELSFLDNTMSKVSLLRLKGYGGQAGVSVQVSGKIAHNSYLLVGPASVLAMKRRPQRAALLPSVI